MGKSYRSEHKIILGALLLLSFVLAGCQPSAPTPTATMETETVNSTDSGELAVTEAPPEISADDKNPLPADPIAMTFTTRDGVELSGTFYPAAVKNAPVIVLMHWALGDQSDWRAVAAWLQNRDLQVAPGGADEPWLDSSWFPTFAEEYTFNVFTFSFRGCESGCATFDREGWKLDVEAAMTEVVRMENINRSEVLTIGASIGADGAAYGCHNYNNQLGGCQGAFSLSPGGYLDIPYAQEVASLEAELIGRPAWALYAVDDTPSAAASREASGSLFRAVEYPGGLHGMWLINPNQTPNPLDLILEFIHDYLECDICSL